MHARERKIRAFALRELLLAICLIALFDREAALDAKQSAEGIGGNLPNPSAQSYDANALGVPTLARIWPTDNKLGVSEICHALHFYGLGPTDLPSYSSGKLLLKVLTDENTAVQTFGASPFQRTRNGLRFYLSIDPVAGVHVGESHPDLCLATFAALDLPLMTEIRLKAGIYTVSNLLAESVATFDIQQRELAWTAISFAKYLPPRTRWTDRFGETTSFSELTRHLMNTDLDTQSCGGTHVFQALIQIYKADTKAPILDNETRNQLGLYLIRTTKEAIQHQKSDGGWNLSWCDSSHMRAGQDSDAKFNEQLLITGHLLEVLNSLGDRQNVPVEVRMHAAKWLSEALESSALKRDFSLICPYTHAITSMRETYSLTNNVAYSKR